MNNKTIFVFFIATIAALSGILFGYDTGVISGAILFIAKQFHLSSAMNGVVVSSVLLGACIGALFSGRLTDYIGRKRMLIIDAIIFIAGTLLTANAHVVSALILGRIVVGIAIGIASFTAPLYISEISPKHLRGALVALNQLAIAFGIFISYCVDYHFSHHEAWRWMFGVGIIPAIILLIGLFFLPYSPRWIAQCGDHEKALFILNKLRSCRAMAEAELADIIHNLGAQKIQKNALKTLFLHPFRKTLLIGAGLSLIQQLTGINTILYYAPTIFHKAGLVHASDAIFSSIAIGIVFLVFTLVGVLLIDRLGRKPLLYAGVSFMGLSLAIMSMALHDNPGLSLTKIVLFSGILLYVMSFAVSLGPIPWVLISEVFPSSIRGLGASIATLVNWASNGFVALTFLSCAQYFGQSNTFLLYSATCVLSLVFIYYCVPETKQCSLEQFESNLISGKPMRELGQCS